MVFIFAHKFRHIKQGAQGGLILLSPKLIPIALDCITFSKLSKG